MIVLVLAIVDAIHLTRSPVSQRDEARTRLNAIKGMTRSFKIEPVALDLFPGEALMVRVEVENRGRGGDFSVTIESIEGSDVALRDRYAYLLWTNRHDEVVEQMPTGDPRIIGVGWLFPGNRTPQGRLVFAPAHPTGYAQKGRNYSLSPGLTTVWIRVSLRNSPEWSYTRRIGVTIDWPGPGSDFALGFIAAEKTESFTPSLATLLDF